MLQPPVLAIQLQQVEGKQLHLAVAPPVTQRVEIAHTVPVEHK